MHSSNILPVLKRSRSCSWGKTNKCHFQQARLTNQSYLRVKVGLLIYIQGTMLITRAVNLELVWLRLIRMIQDLQKRNLHLRDILSQVNRNLISKHSKVMEWSKPRLRKRGGANMSDLQPLSWRLGSVRSTYHLNLTMWLREAHLDQQRIQWR